MKKYIFNVDNQDFNVEILSIENGYAQVSVNEEVINIQIKQGDTTPVSVVKTEPNVIKASPTKAEAPIVENKPVSKSNGKVFSTLKSPLPGILIGLNIKVGDRVKINQEILVLEAMKMENNITSECDGVVLAINAHIGEAVLQGDVIVEFGE
ncbi:MAG: biotin/lipoyl-containing protein [Bacteroidota bacterium]